MHEVSEDAKPVLAKKPNLRVLTVARRRVRARGSRRAASTGASSSRRATSLLDDARAWKIVTKRAPTRGRARALSRSRTSVLRGVVSNAIVVAGENATYGIGGGRTSRVDACRDAVGKAGERAKGAVAASDAFFPFPDGLEVLAEAGVTAVVQPGGSVKDADVIAAADARGHRDGVHGQEALQALNERRTDEILRG